MTDRGPWLDDHEQRVWRQWLALTARLPAALHRQLQDDWGLSLPDFDVLVRLTDVAAGRVRTGDLAEALQWERSRLSHHVRRMEGRGLVAREECADDGRGSFVVLTDTGRAAIEAAAPDHVRMVRGLLLDPLGADGLAALDLVTSTALARLEALGEAGTGAGTGEGTGEGTGGAAGEVRGA